MKKALIILAMALVAVVVHAEVFSFNFHGTNGPFDFDAPTGEITTNGITMSFAAVVSGDPDADLNGTASSYGVNATGSDSTSLLDPNQAITISFSSSIYTSIELQVIDATSFGGSDAGYYQINAGSHVALTGNDQSISPSVEVLGKTLTFASTAGAISFSGITVDAVPEPATLAMFGIGGLIAFIIRRSALK